MELKKEYDDLSLQIKNKIQEQMLAGQGIY